MHNDVNWNNGQPPPVFCNHKLCKAHISGKNKLEQAIKNKKHRRNQTNCFYTTIFTTAFNDRHKIHSNTHARNVGDLHNKNLCVWCSKPEDKKYLPQGKLCKIEQKSAWNTFKLHTVHIEDESMCDRLLRVISVINTTDAFAAEIRYHQKCWNRYCKNVYTTDESSTNHIQNVRSAEVKTMFIEHVRKVIFELNEPRTLLGLLQDFKDMYGNYGFDVTATKSSYIKIILHPELDSTIDIKRMKVP